MSLKTVLPSTEHHHHYEHHHAPQPRAMVIALWVIALLLLLLFLEEHGWAQGLEPTGNNVEHVICDSGCGSPPATADQTTFTAGSTNVTPTAGVFNDGLANLTSGQYGAYRMTLQRALHVNLRDATGAQFFTAANLGHVSCDSGCAGGASTPADTFTTPTTAGLQMTFPMLWNGATFDRLYGDKTNGAWVNCKTGCAGGSTTPADTFSNPTTAGLQFSFPAVWNGTTWDRLYGDKTNGAFVNIKNSVSLAVTGTFWQATQPVSGTVTTTPPANASTNVAQVAGTTTDTNSGAKSAGTLRVVLATDQPALTNKLLVTPDSVALPANQSVNVNQLAGTTTDTNSGTKSAGTLRVVLATDQPALTNKLLVTPDSVALPANQSVNVSQVNGATTSTAASGVQKVGIVGNAGATVDAASGATAATNSVLHGAAYNTTKPTPTSGQQVPVQTDAYSNVYVNSNPYPAVQLAQAVNNKVSAGAGTTLTNAFGSATVAGNSILCIGFEGVAATPVFTDAQGNTYTVAISSGAAAPGYSVAIASNIVGGTTDTITETTSSGSASFSCYELKGAVSVGQTWDYAAPAQATSASLVFAQQSAAIANDFVAVGVGMAAGTINATPSLAGTPSNLTTVDQANTAPLGTAALAVYYSAHANVSNSPTFTQALSLSASETYSAVLVAVKPASISLVGNVQDPCQQGAGTSGNISLTASGQLITGASGKLTYICGMNFITATAQNIALVEGTGSTCATGIAGMAGGTTAATGWNFAANGGFVNGGGGFWVFKTATPGDNVCLLLSGSGQTSGSYRQVQQ